MKKCLILSFLICAASACQTFGVGLSETNNGIYLAIAAFRSGFVTNEPIFYDDVLIWSPFCNTNTKPIKLNYPAPKYGIKIKMLGPDGKEVTKTFLGKSFGTDFDHVHTRTDVVHVGGVGGPYSGHFAGIEAQGRYEARGGGFTGAVLPTPKDLFEMEKPGIYTLEIQMQMFRNSGSRDPATCAADLIRFSPVKIKVEKPPVKVK